MFGMMGRLRPAGFPHAHAWISNILGHGYKLIAINLGLCPQVGWLAGWLNPIMVMVIVMVSINFASLNPGLQAYLRPAGFPHAHPRIKKNLPRGSKSLGPGPRPPVSAAWVIFEPGTTGEQASGGSKS